VENGLAPVAPVHDVADRTRIFNAQLSGHAGNNAEQSENCQSVGLTPLRKAMFLLSGLPGTGCAQFQ
jgi:hypothetical protein